LLLPSFWLDALLLSTGFIAGTVDAIAGGGGLISLPMLLMVGLPPHLALGTNKLQASIGTLTATLNYFRHGFIRVDKIILGLIASFIGASLGALTAQLLSSQLLQKLIIVFLLLIFLYTVLRPKIGLQESAAKISATLFFILFGFLLSFYDGFLGPGTGSFWIMALVFFLGLNLAQATAYTKVFNLESNLVALAWFIGGNNVNYKMGLIMAVGQIIGGKLGSHLVIKKGAAFVRPIFLCVVLVTLVVMIYRNVN